MILDVGPKARIIPEQDYWDEPGPNGFMMRRPCGVRSLSIEFEAPMEMFQELLRHWQQGLYVATRFQYEGYKWSVPTLIMEIQTPVMECVRHECRVKLRSTGEPKRLYPLYETQFGTSHLQDALRFVHKEFSIGIALNDAQAGEFVNCRCAPILVPPMKEKIVEKKTKVQNRFYVASDAMMSANEQGTVNDGPVQRNYEGRHTRWAKKDLKSAIDHAREILEKNPTKQEVAIVRIVKVVRRKPMPIIVDDVR